MEAIVMRLLDQGDLVPLLVVLGSLLAGVVIVGFICLRSIVVARAREETRREIAAYVAEGSMSAKDAASILHHDPVKAAELGVALEEAAGVLEDPGLAAVAKKVKAGKGCCFGFGVVGS